MASSLELVFRKARSAEKRGDEAAARRLLEDVLQAYPRNATARQGLARLDARTAATAPQVELDRLLAAHRRGDHAETIRVGEAILDRFPVAEGVNTLIGAARLAIKAYAEAERNFRAELAAQPGVAGHHLHVGIALLGQDRLEDAEAALTTALDIDPDNVDAHFNMSILHEARGHLSKAIEASRAVLALAPEHVEAGHRIGIFCNQTRIHKEAIPPLLKVLEIQPDHGGALYELGRSLLGLNQHGKAAETLRLAARLDPDNADIHSDLAHALGVTHQYDDAVIALARATELLPTNYSLWGRLLTLQAQVCEWSSRHAWPMLPIDTPQMGLPFDALVFEDDPVRQLQRSQVYAARHFTGDHPPFELPERKAGGKIRVGYLSADFFRHATHYLMAGLFREHDRSRFEIYCYDLSPMNVGPTLAPEGADKFVDIRQMPDREALNLIRSHELDIAIDMKGYTKDSRAYYFAARIAPVQINYLGYPGSMGLPEMDYIIADPVVIPDGDENGYSERVVRLPHSYQPNDDQRVIAELDEDRKSCGLPEQSFVFCCFNQSYKIGPREFDIWMPLLREVEGSVLWLLNCSGKAKENLQKEAAARGVDPARLVFAGVREHSRHLARIRHADLFLDTFHVNAHTTASDALWGGLPVLTLAGRQFAARVGASLVQAVGLPEMVVQTEQAYFDKALELARSPDKLAAIKSQLAINRLSQPLFDTAGYARQIEAAYEAVHRRRLDGLAPDHIRIA
ncbi:O-linked N-acetylglucosamine transferase, SPINDLY family protein [Sphingomonas abietis]|uniref:protein O-GlcNAc transferase n=1 Tax=Sphingomonas abietis TaxID=3012344 RepID=A0ABY7NQB3_9SPHN|nr:tetratricopeptide repeat protein [Sphingomonas abietis]WBO22124.1 tetratricopeptide repeat protein [Sphingomonas abietis]